VGVAIVGQVATVLGTGAFPLGADLVTRVPSAEVVVAVAGSAEAVPAVAVHVAPPVWAGRAAVAHEVAAVDAVVKNRL